MSSVCVLTPIVVGSWPAISAAIFGAASAMGFSVASADHDNEVQGGHRTVETEIANSEVLAETLARGEKVRIVKDGVTIEFSVDDRGHCTVCASGNRSKAELKKIGEEVAGRVVQQFAYHKLVTELKQRGYDIAEESVGRDQSIQLRVQLGR